MKTTLQKEETLKRTRRVEVIRYSRRSTLISSDELALEADVTAEQAAIDVLLGISCAIETPLEEPDFQRPDHRGRRAGDIDPGGIQKRRPLRFLKRLIRG